MMAMPTSALGKGRGVVDAVADHDDLPARRFLLPDEAGLILRQHLSVELIHAHLPGHGLGGLLVVTGHHDHLADAAGVERLNGRLGLFPQGSAMQITAARRPAMHRYR